MNSRDEGTFLNTSTRFESFAIFELNLLGDRAARETSACQTFQFDYLSNRKRKISTDLQDFDVVSSHTYLCLTL